MNQAPQDRNLETTPEFKTFKDAMSKLVRVSKREVDLMLAKKVLAKKRASTNRAETTPG